MNTDLNTHDVAKQFGCSRRKIRELARQLGIGYDLGGRAGFRFTPADVDRFRTALAPKPPVEQKRTA